MEINGSAYEYLIISYRWAAALRRGYRELIPRSMMKCGLILYMKDALSPPCQVVSKCAFQFDKLEFLAIYTLQVHIIISKHTVNIIIAINRNHFSLANGSFFYKTTFFHNPI